MLKEIRETDAEISMTSEQQTAPQTAENFHNKKQQQSRSQPKYKNSSNCSNCMQLEIEIQKLSITITQMKSVEHNLRNQLSDLQKKIDESSKALQKKQKYLEEAHSELRIYQDKLHSESMNNGIQSKTNIELRRTILKLEQDNLLSNKALQDVNDELSQIKSKYNYEHKFIESLLHMVISCHPDNSFREPPSLKQAWKWLKLILSDYMTIKQHCIRMQDFQESSGQSSSSTNK